MLRSFFFAFFSFLAFLHALASGIVPLFFSLSASISFFPLFDIWHIRVCVPIDAACVSGVFVHA